MSKRTVLLIGLVAAVAGVWQKGFAQERFLVDEVVAVVGNSPILYSEVSDVSKQLVEERRQMGYTSDRDPFNEALEHMLTQKLLYNQAQIDSVQTNTDDLPQRIEDYVHQLVEAQGSLAAVEALFHKPIFDIKEDLRKKYEEMRYAQEMQNTIQSKVKVTPGEVERFYKRIDKDSLPIIPEQYVYAQITKYPPSLKEAKQRVRERMLELRERILKGARFDMLARAYSMDPGSAIRGGELDPSPKESYVQPFADALSKLKPDQISEVVETDFGFHLIQLIDKKGNLYHARHILLQPTFTDDELAATDKQLDSVVNLIRLDSITFAKAAEEFSDDQYSRLNGGLVSSYDDIGMASNENAQLTPTRFFKENLPPEDFMALRNLKPGEISAAFQTRDQNGNAQSKVVKLLEIIPAHPASLKEDYLRLEQLALQDKQAREFHKWLNEKIAAMYIRIEPEYRNGDFENKAWLK